MSKNVVYFGKPEARAREAKAANTKNVVYFGKPEARAREAKAANTEV